jgi:hypothetical protein
MQNPYDVSSADQDLYSKLPSSRKFSLRAAFLGAAVGIAGPAYFGTVISNVSLRVLLAQGQSVAEAYAQIGKFDLSLPFTLSMICDVFFAIACGYVSASLGNGRHLIQGLTSSLIVCSFILVMLINPSGNTSPYWYIWAGVGISIIGGIAGAYAYQRKAKLVDLQ